MIREGIKKPVKKKVLKKKGDGLMNRIIDALPFEAHLPGYNYCGPGTKLDIRLARGDKGVNPLDEACKAHDIAYSKSSDIKLRNAADRILAEKAWKRVTAADAKFGERAFAWAVANTMKAKAATGSGFSQIVQGTRNLLSKCKTSDPKQAIGAALKIAKMIHKKMNTSKRKSKLGRRKYNRFKIGRVIPIPKTGGLLKYVIPIVAGLKALGKIKGGVKEVIKVVSDIIQLRKGGSLNVERIGKGLYLKPYRNGYGLYLNKIGTKNL